MIKQVTLQEFEEKYAFNEQRKELCEKFKEELTFIASQCTHLRVLVFGSYLTRKKQPNDIDLLLALIPCRDCVYSIMKDGLKQLYPGIIDVQYKKTQRWLKDPEGLIDFFHENRFNRKEGIVVKKTIELIEFL